jgi:hypothetical protein
MENLYGGIGAVATVIGVIFAYLQWQNGKRQVALMQQASSGVDMETLPEVTISRWRLYWPLAVMALLVILVWVPYLTMQLQQESPLLRGDKDAQVAFTFPKWPDPYRPIVVVGKTFKNTEVLLDGYSYDHCTFDHVTFVYNGTTTIMNVFPTIVEPYDIRTDNLAIEGTVLMLKGLGLLKPALNLNIKSPGVIVREPGEPVE